MFNETGHVCVINWIQFRVNGEVIFEWSRYPLAMRAADI